MSRAQAKLAALLSWLVVGACAATIAEVAEAADAAIYRKGDFGEADVDMASCPADALGTRHPELTFAIAATLRGELALSGGRSVNAGSVLWTIVTKKTGDNALTRGIAQQGRHIRRDQGGVAGDRSVRETMNVARVDQPCEGMQVRPVIAEGQTP
jgi:hypothetical protein